jgi:two-component system, NarL family, nitrate/nitrite response regulator NarL
LVADDHPLYRTAIAGVIKQDPRLELIGEAEDGGAALEAIREQQPDVAVVDMSMPDLDGLAILRAVARDELKTSVLIVSAEAESRVVYEAIAAGARAYLMKTGRGEAITEAIQRVTRGEVVFPPELQAGIADQIQMHSPQGDVHLTPREHEVLKLISSGSTTPQIAEKLFLSAATIKTHVQHIYEKLGVSDRASAVMEATRRGLLE